MNWIKFIVAPEIDHRILSIKQNPKFEFSQLVIAYLIAGNIHEAIEVCKRENEV